MDKRFYSLYLFLANTIPCPSWAASCFGTQGQPIRVVLLVARENLGLHVLVWSLQPWGAVANHCSALQGPPRWQFLQARAAGSRLQTDPKSLCLVPQSTLHLKINIGRKWRTPAQGHPDAEMVYEVVSGRGVTNVVTAESALAASQQRCHHLCGATVRCGLRQRNLLYLGYGDREAARDKQSCGAAREARPGSSQAPIPADERGSLKVSSGCRVLLTPKDRRSRTWTSGNKRPSLGSWWNSPAYLCSGPSAGSPKGHPLPERSHRTGPWMTPRIFILLISPSQQPLQ